MWKIRETRSLVLVSCRVNGPWQWRTRRCCCNRIATLAHKTCTWLSAGSRRPRTFTHSPSARPGISPGPSHSHRHESISFLPTRPRRRDLGEIQRVEHARRPFNRTLYKKESDRTVFFSVCPPALADGHLSALISTCDSDVARFQSSCPPFVISFVSLRRRRRQVYWKTFDPATLLRGLSFTLISRYGSHRPHRIAPLDSRL